MYLKNSPEWIYLNIQKDMQKTHFKVISMHSRNTCFIATFLIPESNTTAFACHLLYDYRHHLRLPEFFLPYNGYYKVILLKLNIF